MIPTPESLSALCDRIEKLAEKATPGPYAHGSGRGLAGTVRCIPQDGHPISRYMAKADAAYLASLDPRTVLRLVAAARAGEAMAEHLNARAKDAIWTPEDCRRATQEIAAWEEAVR